MEFIILFAVASVLAFTIYKGKLFKRSGVPTILLILILSLKFGAGLAINKYFFDRYENQKHSDIHKYFEDGHQLYKIALENPKAYLKIFSGFYEDDPSTYQYIDRLSNWKQHTDNYLKTMNYKDANYFNSHRTMARVNSLLCFISQGHLSTQTLIFSFLSFVGIVLVYLTFLKDIKFPNWLVLGIICCTPSLLIWTSSVQKESMMTLGIGLFVYSLFGNRRRHFLLIISCLILLYVSYYNLIILFLSYGLMLIYKRSSRWFLATIISATIGVVFTVLFTSINPLNPIASRYNLQNKIGKGGYYFENVSTGKMIYFEHDSFNKIQGGISSKTGGQLTYYKFLEQIEVHDYSDGNISSKKRLLAQDNGWYYQKLHYIPAKSYMQSSELKPDIKSFFSHLGRALINTFGIPYYDFNIVSISFLIESAFLYLIITTLILVHIKRFKSFFSGSNVFLLLFTLITILLIGYSTPIVGNIIRHKFSVILFLIILAFKFGFSNAERDKIDKV